MNILTDQVTDAILLLWYGNGSLMAAIVVAICIIVMARQRTASREAAAYWREKWKDETRFDNEMLLHPSMPVALENNLLRPRCETYETDSGTLMRVE